MIEYINDEEPASFPCRRISNNLCRHSALRERSIAVNSLCVCCESDFLPEHTVCKGGGEATSVERPDKSHLSQEVKFNIIGEKS